MRRLSLLIGLALAATALTPAPVAAETRNPRSAPPIYLVMDVSGSMDGQRMAAAKTAALEFVQALQPEQTFALYTFPGGKKVVDNCSAGHFAIPPSQIETSQAGAAVRILSADGNTPTVPALKEILRSIDERGYDRAQVVLVTDGEANCGESSDVCSIVPLLDQKDVDLRIHTVSLNNTPTGDASLACLAEATGGESTNVHDPGGMIDAIREASSYVADLSVDIPRQLSTVTGSSASLASRMTIKATATGSTRIPDARLVISFKSGTPSRQVRVPSPIYTLGNLDPDVTLTVQTGVYPYATTNGPATWVVSLLAGGVPIAKQTGTVEIVSSSDIATAGSILSAAENVVVLGDSYSSGEGSGDYLTGGSVKAGECHRSNNSWGNTLFPEAEMIACSGALSLHMTSYNPGSTGFVEAQLESLLTTTDDDTPPDLVLMTLGGNDVGFADVVKSSVLSGGPFSVASMYRDSEELTALQASLSLAYSRINRVVNNQGAVTARNGKIAQILVLAYALGVPPAGNKCFLGFNPDEISTMYGFGLGLNNIVEAAVTQARTDGVPVHYVGSVEDAFQPHHTICDADSYLRTDLGTAALQELMHPTKAGQRAIAQSVIEWSRAQHPLPLSVAPQDYRTIRTVTPAPPGARTRMLGNLDAPIPVPGIVWEPGSEINPAISCPGDCAWGEGIVTVTLQSLPVPLGSVWVSSGGTTPQGRIQIPLETEPGLHTLVLRGIDIRGEPLELRQELTVWRPGSNTGIGLGIFGIVLLGSSAGVIVGLLRRSRTP